MHGIFTNNNFRCLDSVIFELRGVRNGGVGPKISILVLIFPYILRYGIFTNFGQFLPILYPWESVIFKLSGVENGGVGPKMSILVLIVPYILMYGIFTHFRRF
jgi:hypothetical protein